MEGTSRPTRAIAASVERGLHIAIGVVILAKTTVFAASLTERASYDAGDVALSLAVVGCVGLAGVRCVLGRPGRVDVLLCTLAMVAGALLHQGSTPRAGAADSPIIHLVEPMLLVLAARLPAATVLALAGLYVLLRWETGGSAIALRYGVQEAAFIAGTVLAVFVLVGLMRRTSARAEEALRAEGARQAAAGDRAEVEATAFVHDDLVPALLSVASLPRAEPTLAAATAALDGLTTQAPVPSRAPLADQLRAVADSSGLDVVLVVRGRRAVVPEDVRDALVGAVREALRNVARHSGGHRATITLTQRAGRVRLTVEDDGVGFVVTPGVGLRVAVTGRVEAAGGTARVASTPGAGTVVTLDWRAHRIARLLGLSSDNDTFARAAVGRPGRAALRVCGVLVAGYAASGLLLAFDGVRQPATWAGAAAVSVLVVLLARRIDRGPVSVGPLVLGALVPAAVLATVLPTVSVDGLGGLESWIVEFTALPAMVLAWTSSLRVVALLLVPNAVVIACVALQAGLPAADLPHLLFVQPLNTFFVAVIIGVCRRAGLVLAGIGATPDCDRAGATRGLLGPLLPEVERTLAKPTCIETAAGAAVLAHAVRDCLYLPGPAHLALREELHQLRRTGTHVVVNLHDPLAASATLASAVAVLRAVAPGRVTLSGTGTRASLVVVPAVSAAAADAVTAALPRTWVATFDPDATLLAGPPGELEVAAVAGCEVSPPGDRRPAHG
ncbi:sensor histidine kinase [Nocardioides nitrophenolicus]|uniref:sensor histidine kinase n=1 Tax=Nocardioides nitrophenolicus TaxID=60489 RepID=UPI00195BA225|nr:ATP-binding protein [Nocardioides nitrophenolicus]MBM7517031.1 signal transduction histidine kinase [Nocardioides nitrophenolicus]